MNYTVEDRDLVLANRDKALAEWKHSSARDVAKLGRVPLYVVRRILADADRVVIGTGLVTEDHEFSLSYECAAWWKTVKVAAGTRVDVTENHFEDGNGRQHTTVSVSFPVTVTGASFRSRIGAHTGGDRGPDEVGNVESYGQGMARRQRGGWTAGDYGDRHDTREAAVLDWLNGSEGFPAQAPARWLKMDLTAPVAL